MAAESTDVRLARLEGAFEQISLRLSAIESRLEQMDTRLDGRISRLEVELGGRVTRLEGKVERQFYWMIGLIIIAILVPIGLRFVPLP